MNLNQNAHKLFNQVITNSEALGVKVLTLTNGATVIDAGVEGIGSLTAGKYFAEICLGGVGQVHFTQLNLTVPSLPGIFVVVDRPVLGCIASQYAGWKIRLDGGFETRPCFAMGSGPARLLARVEKLFSQIDYREKSSVAVIALESSQLPVADVAQFIAEKCQVHPEDLFIIVASTDSLTGSVQIAARIVETGMHKMLELGFDLNKILSGFGICPIAPIIKDSLKAIGRTNDCILYGGDAYYTVCCDDSEITRILDRIPASSSKDYGFPFYELFQRYQNFYQIDPLLFSPARITLNNVSSGRVFQAGYLNEKLLLASLSS
jgi:methenyltetrahydromethanopterin cyclohydrolase